MSRPLAVAVLGQGSIGRRHAGILVELGCNVLVYDPRTGLPAVAGTTRAATPGDALAPAVAAVVASPTCAHVDDALLALSYGCHVLCEKPLAADEETAVPVVEAAAARGLLLAVGMNLRFHPGPATVHRELRRGAVGRPLVAHVTFGSYLPDWRPGTDYRQSYSARRELGGGVLLDVVHELDYTAWMLGPVTEVSAWLGRVSQLEVDVEDVALLRLGFASGGAASVDLDYLDRAYRRACRVVGSEGTVEWSFEAERVVVHRPGGEPVVSAAPSDVAPTYRAQLDHFMTAVREGRTSLDGLPLVDGCEALAVLRVVDAARLSARSARRIALHPS